MKIKFIAITLLGLFSACKNSPSPTIAPSQSGVTIDLQQRFQTMESFAASDCWEPAFVGQYWAEEQKASIAKLLFSKDIVSGQPQGIGLSQWRVNLGGGTHQQGVASGIADYTRRADSFIDIKTGQIDWNKNLGQEYFLQKAKEFGVEEFVLFSNTPPVLWTKNNKGYASSAPAVNLQDDKFDDFADYMALVLDHYKKQKGISFKYISPVNEPQHNWMDPTQEGSPWRNEDVAKIARELNKSLEKSGLDTKILLAEAGDWASVYEAGGDAARKNVINNLFNSGSENYIGNLSHVAPIIAGHSYWTDGSWAQLLDIRSKVKAAADAANLKVYQTEWSMLGDGYDANEFVGFDKASYMDIALYMSKVIHTDIVYANAAAWSYWTSMATERWGHKNRFLLINLKPNGDDHKNGGTHEATKTLWVLGNYSRFIRPGYQRVALKLANENKEKFGTAYSSPDGKTLVAVYTNLSKEPFNAKVKLSGVKSIKAYTTSSAKNLAEEKISNVDSDINIPPGSVVTVVYEF